MKPVRLSELPVVDTHGTLGHALPEAANGPLVTQTLARRGALARIENALGWAVEVPAALLVVADIVVLLAGVVARFVPPRQAGACTLRAAVRVHDSLPTLRSRTAQPSSPNFAFQSL